MYGKEFFRVYGKVDFEVLRVFDSIWRLCSMLETFVVKELHRYMLSFIKTTKLPII